MEKISYALITGATGGLGKAFVMQLAKRGENLFLTARSQEKLTTLQAELAEKYPQCKIVIFAADLANEADRYALNEKLHAENALLHRLVNVAGADVQKAFTQYSQEKITMQCRVNFEAAVSLCRMAIENKAERLQIINISSVSGIYPMPYFAIYSAAKSALTSFSVSLREEMKGKGVYVTAVLPGAMPTREDIKEQIKGQGVWGKLAVKSPEKVAEVSLNALRKNKRKIILGFWNKVMRITTCWIPSSLRLRFIAKRWSKITKDAF
jgi:short-subunit dehydrogenase